MPLNKALLFTLAGQALASTQRTPGGLYLHVPRGSNNRLNEATAQAQNWRRLFWSNNNRRGGYNVGETPTTAYENQSEQHQMSFFMSGDDDINQNRQGASYLDIEWSQLHGCGFDQDGEKIHNCNMKIQYMCQDDEDSNGNPLDVDNLNDAKTVRNGNDIESVNYKFEPGQYPDPKGDCYRDNSNRDLPELRIKMEAARNRLVINNSTDPPIKESGLENCQRRCAENGYIYVGLQFGSECWCSNSYNKYGKIPAETECNMPCNRDNKHMCGGPWANNVHLTGLSQPSNNGLGETYDEKNVRREASTVPSAGIHESWEYYERCPSHFPNGGDQNHDPRSGFECWTERQSFVDRQSTPWTDIAYMVDDINMCEEYVNYYMAPKFECVELWPGDQSGNGNVKRKHRSSFDNQFDCEANAHQWLPFYKYKSIIPAMFVSSQASCEFRGYTWGRPMNWDDLANDILSDEACLELPTIPACESVKNTRANLFSADDDTYFDGDVNYKHTSAGELPRFKWRLPSEASSLDKNQRCVLRIRQFISTDLNDQKEPKITYANREIEINGDPLYLAVPQWRTDQNNVVVFEDRSHVFKLKPRTGTDISQDQTLHNIIVRGKRGNIVQTFPALEYDFSPAFLSIDNNDALHIQWTGSNTHDNDQGGDGQAGDDGEGRGGTDRNNFMQMLSYKHNFPMPYEASTFFKNMKRVLWSPLTGGASLGNNTDTINYNAELAYASGGYYWCKDASDCGDLSYESKSAIDDNEIDERYNNVSPSFEGIVFVPGDDQEIYYMCLRNNNFSNRSQKGRLTVGNGPAPEGDPVPQQDMELSQVCGKPIYKDEL